MTASSIVLSILRSVSLAELIDTAAELIDGATEEEAAAIVEELLDQAIPEELLGTWADAVAEPLYALAAERIVRAVTRRARKATLKPAPYVPPIVADVLARGR